MHDRKTVPTFLVFGGGFVFLIGLAAAWIIDLAASAALRILGHRMTTGGVLASGGLTLMGMQWALVALWRGWNSPKPPRDEGDSIRLTPDKRHHLQTGQGGA